MWAEVDGSRYDSTTLTSFTSLGVAMLHTRWFSFFALILGLALFATSSPADDTKKKPAEKKDKKDDAIRSLVFLRKKPLKLEEAKLTAAFQAVFPKQKIGTEETDDIKIVVTDISAICVLTKQNLTLLVNSFPKPYVPDRDAMAKDVERISGEKQMAEDMKKHEAWFSVDILGEKLTEKNEAAHYELLSKIIAQFHDKDTTLLYLPEKDKLRAANAAALKLLKQGKVLDLANDGIINIENDDPEMKAATEKARKQWPDFVKAFANKTGENHSVKFKFSQKDSHEYMWVSVDKIEGDTVIGKLANVPNFLTNVKEGAIVKRPSTEIEDWLYVEDKKLVGGFSIEVLQNRQKKRNEKKE
jgi:uncharacterized protein YegJ (DUF2314 family)